MTLALEFLRAHRVSLSALTDFFSAIKIDDETREFFHPHAFDELQAKKIIADLGPDLYFVALADSKVIAYGILRGWAEGYSIPALGIAVRRDWRGKGIARQLLSFLHFQAHLNGANSVMLKVDQRNSVAKNLYESEGYVFAKDQPGPQLVGYITL
ncbi:GNAT family N-acetyltransferase [Azospira oryzae]|uniref:GNAT family N-acetyltransferase n=1 Tax=Azospira oryzae TaxID=146939 RepID=UPI0019639D65|nr:GNAT family N-acetyltransferase [Azospira oryzae]